MTLIARMAPALVPALLAAGCFGQQSQATLRPVSGTIRRGSVPLPGAEVVFLPVEPDTGVRAARGVTDAEGRYSLKTYIDPRHDAAGAAPARYRVVITEGSAAANHEKRIVDPYTNVAPLPPTTSAGSITRQPDEPAATTMVVEVVADAVNVIDLDCPQPRGQP